MISRFAADLGLQVPIPMSDEMWPVFVVFISYAKGISISAEWQGPIHTYSYMFNPPGFLCIKSRILHSTLFEHCHISKARLEEFK